MCSNLARVAIGLSLTLASVPAAALPISSTDLWQNAAVTSHTGMLFSSDARNMFGGAFGSIEVGNALFRDGQPTGTLHAVEWSTTATVTLRSIVLNAAHDGAPRDATARGFSTFRLFAWNAGVSSFVQIFAFNPANPYRNSIAPANGFVDTSVTSNVLSLGVNLTPVVSDRFRAEFVQYGFFASNASGPRIMELDGFDTYLTQATVPPPPLDVPAPGAMALLGAGLFVLGWARRRYLGVAAKQ